MRQCSCGMSLKDDNGSKRNRHIKPNSRGEVSPNKLRIKNNQKRRHNDCFVIYSLLWHRVLECGFNCSIQSTNWQSTHKRSFYVNLGSSQQVQNVYFWVQKRQRHSHSLFWYAGNWSYQGQFVRLDFNPEAQITRSISTLDVKRKHTVS